MAGTRRIVSVQLQLTGAHDRCEEDEDLQTTERFADTTPRAEAERVERLGKGAVDARRPTSARRVVDAPRGHVGSPTGGLGDNCTNRTRGRFVGGGALPQEPLRTENVDVAVPDVRVAPDRPQVGDDDAASRDGQIAAPRRAGDIDVDAGEVWKGERNDRRQSHRFQNDRLDVRKSASVGVRQRLTGCQFAVQLRMHLPL